MLCNIVCLHPYNLYLTARMLLNWLFTARQDRPLTTPFRCCLRSCPPPPVKRRPEGMKKGFQFSCDFWIAFVTHLGLLDAPLGSKKSSRTAATACFFKSTFCACWRPLVQKCFENGPPNCITLGTATLKIELPLRKNNGFLNKNVLSLEPCSFLSRPLCD